MAGGRVYSPSTVHRDSDDRPFVGEKLAEDGPDSRGDIVFLFSDLLSNGRGLSRGEVLTDPLEQLRRADRKSVV